MDKKTIWLVIALVAIIASVIAIQSETSSKREVQDGIEVSLQQDNSRTRIKETIYDRAKELAGISGYVNTEKITIAENIGKKVILVDFWTYSCINCQRTLPYLNSWWEKYEDDGLLIIGVHTPEFEFEKEYGNLLKAVDKYQVKYPVVQDNEYKTWTSYNNRYWPRKYLIDIDGFIVYDHIGEGAYEETETKIQELLKEREEVLGLNENIESDIARPDADKVIATGIGTPEIYFGLLFSRKQFGNPEGWQADKIVSYKYPGNIERNKFYLDGSWKNNPDNMELVSQEGKIKILYQAKNVNLVAGGNNPVEIVSYLDGKEHKRLQVNEFDLYNVASLDSYGQHELEIRIMQPGLMAYTFTFG